MPQGVFARHAGDFQSQHDVRVSVGKGLLLIRAELLQEG
jgi:hypothetical protein